MATVAHLLLWKLDHFAMALIFIGRLLARCLTELLGVGQRSKSDSRNRVFLLNRGPRSRPRYKHQFIVLTSLLLLLASFCRSSSQVDQRSIIRTCLGAELGAGAEIDFILGFSDAVLTKDFVCGSIFADVDAALIGAAGVSTGVSTYSWTDCILLWILDWIFIHSFLLFYSFFLLLALNGNFFYEFTLGGGLGAGLGGGACFGFPYGIVNSTDTPP